MVKKTFSKGGIHPSDKKSLSENEKSEIMSIPAMLNVSLWQHIGKPATATVSRGDMVEEASVIGEMQGFVSSFVHAPVSGKIGFISSAPPPLGRNALAVEIQTDSEYSPKEYKRDESTLSLSIEDTLGRIKNAGVVGMGGAMFPTHVKLSPPKDKEIDTLIVNAAECEPYITSDNRLIIEKTDELFYGIEITRRILNVKRVVIGIEDNKPEAIEILLKKAEGLNIEIDILQSRYPQGGEKQLIEALTKREVPSGKLPMDAGVVVQNTATLIAIHDAVMLNKPLTERLVTVSGEAIAKPKNLWVKIGTKIEDIINYCGGLTEENVILLNGGPMMGFALPSQGQHTVKGTNAIIALKDDGIKHLTYPCIRCGRCVKACPTSLVPRDIADAAKNSMKDKMNDANIMDCIECGACAYGCPSRIPLVQYIRAGKNILRGN